MNTISIEDIKGRLVKMEKTEIVYQNRILKITRCLTGKCDKYKIKMTDGRFYESWEECFSNEKQAIEGAKQVLKKFVQIERR